MNDLEKVANLSIGELDIILEHACGAPMRIAFEKLVSYRGNEKICKRLGVNSVDSIKTDVDLKRLMVYALCDEGQIIIVDYTNEKP